MSRVIRIKSSNSPQPQYDNPIPVDQDVVHNNLTTVAEDDLKADVLIQTLEKKSTDEPIAVQKTKTTDDKPKANALVVLSVKTAIQDELKAAPSWPSKPREL